MCDFSPHNEQNWLQEAERIAVPMHQLPHFNKILRWNHCHLNHCFRAVVHVWRALRFTSCSIAAYKKELYLDPSILHIVSNRELLFLLHGFQRLKLDMFGKRRAPLGNVHLVEVDHQLVALWHITLIVVGRVEWTLGASMQEAGSATVSSHANFTRHDEPASDGWRLCSQPGTRSSEHDVGRLFERWVGNTEGPQTACVCEHSTPLTTLARCTPICISLPWASIDMERAAKNIRATVAVHVTKTDWRLTTD